MSIVQLQKQANTAPKYVLKMQGLELYVADQQKLTGCNITDDINQARKYSVGFDNEEIKAKTWTVVAQKQSNNKDLVFEVKYL